MLPGSPAVSLVQNYLRAQQGVIETTRAAPDQLLLTVGEQVRATVTSQLPNGRFAVLIKDQLLDLNLPRNTQPGEQFDLVVASKEPKLTFTLSQSAQPQQAANTSSGVALSQTAKLLGDLVAEQTATESKAATVQQPVPLFDGDPVPEQLASQLATRLAESGLFYESHQAEWANGERPLLALLREPQAQIAAQTADPGNTAMVAKPETAPLTSAPFVTANQDRPAESVAHSSSRSQPTALPASPEQQIRHLVQQQVQLLENQPLVWQGQAWPGQGLQWRLELENERDPDHPQSEPQPVWQSRLDMTLPNLGEVGVVVLLRAGQLSLNFEASDPHTVALLRSQQSALAGRFEAAGLSLLMSQVHHHVDETGT